MESFSSVSALMAAAGKNIRTDAAVCRCSLCKNIASDFDQQ